MQSQYGWEIKKETLSSFVILYFHGESMQQPQRAQKVFFHDKGCEFLQ